MKIITVGSPRGAVLRRKAKPVGQVTPQVARLMDQMLALMRAAPGVGLAAPQVGIGRRILVAEYDGITYQLADPEIVRMQGEEMGREGCLSIPGIVCDVRRAVDVVVRAKNRRNRRVEIRATGWLARILQHEIDHLDGILITDRVDGPEHIHRVDELAPEERAEEVVG
ncbi:MAG: peptide deformylase [Armatimonadota bacterium]|nr:peptide deformylase [Armatimonadota bacterium]MDR5696652.1 peptide deformylase [Armatimonadota bacterium]